jgi:hypothetical protein
MGVGFGVGVGRRGRRLVQLVERVEQGAHERVGTVGQGQLGQAQGLDDRDDGAHRADDAEQGDDDAGDVSEDELHGVSPYVGVIIHHVFFAITATP